MDVNTPVENPSLVTAMDRIAESETPENEAVLIEELRRAHFLSPVTMNDAPPEGGEFTLAEGSQIGFHTLQGGDGKKYFLGFTDWSELRLWTDAPDQQTLITSAAMFFDLLADSDAAGVILNPATHRVLLNLPRLSLITGRPALRTVKTETKFVLGIPDVWPSGLASALAKTFRSRPDVRAAWLLLMVTGEDEEQSFLAVVDTDAETSQLFQEISCAVSPHLDGLGLPLDLTSADSELGTAAARAAEPFYRRSAGILGRLRSLLG